VSRHDDLAEQATDYVLAHGIVGLTLRPLAAAINTSDRMLMYHFGDKDTLIAEILERSNDRAVAVISSLPPARSVRRAVLAYWRTWGVKEFEGCLRVYVQTAGLGLLGREPYLSASRRSNESWGSALSGYLTASGAPSARARRIALLVDATLLGLYLDWPVEGDSPRVAQAVRDLADAAQALTEP
jgi:AcrR family transcriptional regulator